MAHLRTVLAFVTFLAAAPAPAAEPATAAAPTPNSSPTTAAKPAETTYCIKMEGFTGSRTTKTECKTKAQWAAEGVDVDNLTH
jgi:hypothetical protein